MKDLYKRLGVSELASPDAIRKAIASSDCSPEDKIAASEILLNPGQRKVYDRTRSTLKRLGILRARLNLNNARFWKQHNYDDFTFQVAHGDSTDVKKGKQFINWKLSFAFTLLLLLLYIFFAYDTDNDRQRSTRQTSNNQSYGAPASRASMAGNVGEVPEEVYLYANVPKLNVRSGASAASSVIGQLVRFETVISERNLLKDAWIKIRHEGMEGYVARKYLSTGQGEKAKYQYCSRSLVRPPNGYIFKQVRTGDHSIVVKSSPLSTPTDAVVKLRDINGRTVLSFFVRKGEEARITTVPEGKYKFQFAAGNNYSRTCGYFLDDMVSSSGHTFDDFSTSISGNYMYATIAEYTLYRVANGNFSTRTISNENFIAD
jgi:hypothetical protein